jgi:hypothetical protein
MVAAGTRALLLDRVIDGARRGVPSVRLCDE